MFQFTTQANVDDVKIIRGTSDDSPTSVEIRFKTEDMSAETIAAALGAESKDDVEQGLFRSLSIDADQGSRFLHLGSIKSKAAWDARHRLTIQGLRPLRCAKVGKIVVTPRGKLRSDLSFTARIESPTKGFLDTLSEMLHRPTKITLEQEAELELKGGAIGTPAKSKPQQGVIDLPRAESTTAKKNLVAESAMSLAISNARAKKDAKNKRDRDRRAAKSKGKPAKRKAA